MFHRVKSEGTQGVQNENATENTEVRQEEVEVAASAPQAASAEEAMPASHVSNQDNTVTQTAEDTDMTEENQAPVANETTQNQGYEAGSATYTTSAAAPGYSGSYAGANRYVAQGNDMPSEDVENRLVISRGITMSGEIEACDHLVVEGSVEAALKGARVLEVEESGVFYGSVEIEEATISGRFEGEIIVNGRLTISATGVVTGSIAYKELEVESGAVIDGRLTPVSALQKNAQAPQTAKPKATKAAAPKETGKQKAAKAMDQMEAANTDGELFSTEMAAAE